MTNERRATLKNVMTLAQQIYKTLKGDHAAKLSLALRQAWKESKEMKEVKEVKFNKKGNDFCVKVNGNSCTMEVKDIQGKVTPTNHPKGGWGYWLDQPLAKLFSGNDTQKVFLSHDSAKKVSELQHEIGKKLFWTKKVGEAKMKEVLEEARRTGKNVKIHSDTVPCNDYREECNVDIVAVWVTPSGDITETRTHTW